MGCDGGTIPKRHELVTLKKKAETKDKHSVNQFRWQYCQVSQEPLKKPIVSCGLGKLYSKENVIQKLLEKDAIPEAMSHIKALKDTKELKLTQNPGFKFEPEKGGNSRDEHNAPFICPISGLEMNGKFKFCFFWTCGCVLAERALKQFNDKVCALCQTPFSDCDVVILNPSDEDLKKNLHRIDDRKASKKSKKVKSESKDETEKATKIKKEKSEPSTSNQKAKRTVEDLRDPAYKKLKISVAKDPKASEVYKSLFSTHEKAKSQEHAHWVTFNPFYN